MVARPVLGRLTGGAATLEDVKPLYNLVTFESMLIGYTDAVARLEAVTGDRDPTTAYNSLFEALNWAVALDERIGTHWTPDRETRDKPMGTKWRERLGWPAPVMAGVRFARNRVHHQWCDAMTAERDLRGVFKNWVWVAAEDLPEGGNREGEDVYREHLQGRPIIVSLDVLTGAFYTLQGWLEPHTLRAQSG